VNLPNDVSCLTLGQYRAELRGRAEWARQVGASAPLAATLDAIDNGLEQVDGVPTLPVQDQYLTAKEAATALRITTKVLHEMARAGKLPFAKRISPRKWRFSKDGLDRYMHPKG
jgi:excisionase family DNA binding protein